MRLLIVALMLFAAAAAHAQFNGCPSGFCGGGAGMGNPGGGFSGGGAAVAQPTGKILMVDGASFILQTDAASKICRAGGC